MMLVAEIPYEHLSHVTPFGKPGQKIPRVAVKHNVRRLRTEKRHLHTPVRRALQRRYGSFGARSDDRLLVEAATRLSIASARWTSVIARSPRATRRLCAANKHVRVRVAGRRLEFVTGELDQEAERILEINRIHEHPIANGRLDPARLEPPNGLHPDGARDVERDMMHTAYVGRRAAMHRLAVLSREHGDEPAVAGIEIDVALVRIVEIGLLENEGHAEHALPEID